MKLSEQEVLRLLMKARDRVSAAAWMVVRDTQTAEDIFQNVALKALTRDVTFEHEGAVMSWAFITARREGIDWLRKHRKESAGMDLNLLEVLEQEWLAEKSQLASARTEALRDCIAQLPVKSQQLMKLRYYDGLACGEVAKHFGAGLNAIYKRISRTHQGLKNCIEAKMVGGAQ